MHYFKFNLESHSDFKDAITNRAQITLRSHPVERNVLTLFQTISIADERRVYTSYKVLNSDDSVKIKFYDSHGACIGTLGLMKCQKYMLYVVRMR